MAHVMKTRLETSPITALHVGPTAQLVENSVCRSSCNRTPITADEEWLIRPGRMSFAALTDIGGKHVDKIQAERYDYRRFAVDLPLCLELDGKMTPCAF